MSYLAPPGSGAPRRVLYVEDDPDMRELLPLAIEECGVAVSTVATFEDADRALVRSAFDLVLTDFLVGTRDRALGWERFEHLRHLSGAAPIGVISGLALTPHELEAHGVDFYLLKPFSTERILARLAETLACPPPGEAERALITAYFRALEQGAWPAMVALCTEDVAYHVPGTNPRFSRSVTGREAFASFAAETFASFQEARFELIAMRTLPRGIVVEYVGSWRTPEGRGASDGSVIFTLRDGAIATVGVRVDLAALP